MYLNNIFSDQSNGVETDFRAEVLAAEMIENNTAPDRVLIVPLGARNRPHRKDVESIVEEVLDYDNKEYVFIKTPREGLYDQLPEGLFHQHIGYVSNKSEQQVLEAIKRHHLEEKAARMFFLPFDVALNDVRVQIALYENQLDKKFHFNQLVNIFSSHWEIFQHLSVLQANVFLQFLPLIHRIRDDWDAIETLFELMFLVPAHLQLSGKRQLILDTETTGFSFKDGDRIIEVGVIEMINRKLTGSSFHVYVNPQRLVGDSENVHGLSDDFLQDKLLFSQIAQELNDYLEGAEIIAHNATFDMNFLEGEFLKAGFPSLKNRVEVTDTLAIAKRKHPGQKNSLDALVRRYEIKQRDRTFHGALLDAEILADVYLAMTGGQVTLDINNDENQSNETIRHRQFKQQFSIPVVSASHSETAAHETWLKQFTEKNANPPIWSTVFN
ncbi:MAG: DNA polymerase III subunit epsilon [Chitinophagaceae bacterium]|nr:MAG: DNA polymerase III subunit epsilon [Chitinophagaceae bacterium]